MTCTVGELWPSGPSEPDLRGQGIRPVRSVSCGLRGPLNLTSGVGECDLGGRHWWPLGPLFLTAAWVSVWTCRFTQPSGLVTFDLQGHCK